MKSNVICVLSLTMAASISAAACQAPKTKYARKIAAAEQPTSAAPLSPADAPSATNAQAPNTNSASGPPPLSGLSVPEMVQADAANATNETIYVSLAHLKVAAEIETARFGLTKALNSLSMSPEIQRLQAVDAANTLYRVHLADFTLSNQDLQTLQKVSGSQQAVQKMGNATVVQGDWLVYAATRPEAYDAIIRLPNFVRNLEQELSVDRSQAVYLNVQTSEVTFNPRVLERIPIEIGGKAGGYYWRSYDFGRKDVQVRGFQNPQNLANAGVGELVAGEYFFSLPNGMQAYMLSGFAGQHRIDAQDFVATDPQRPQDGLTKCVGGVKQCGHVINGESCMSCHSNGVKISSSIVGYKNTTQPEAQALLAQDMARFATAVQSMGFSSTGFEPIKATVEIYKARAQVTDRRQQGSEVQPVRGGGILRRARP